MRLLLRHRSSIPGAAGGENAYLQDTLDSIADIVAGPPAEDEDEDGEDDDSQYDDSD